MGLINVILLLLLFIIHQTYGLKDDFNFKTHLPDLENRQTSAEKLKLLTYLRDFHSKDNQNEPMDPFQFHIMLSVPVLKTLAQKNS
ncbi:uncharacterized protein LOC108115615 [Drosophila eugracilis]|uniref:uncharacterized protein LOC108115615 n=1 Tax=Drosophila eugracilis TaxID=29029 RepID=UPI0007E5EA3C|nr:uncharacterized protein LOC108115615 [Drosophila eugracilis]